MADTPKDKNGKAGILLTDADAIDALPLGMIPLSSNSLKNARIIKNGRMETALELHKDAKTGSLQVSPDKISDILIISEKDKEIINQLANLHSYDVYSLRSTLSRIGVQVDEKMLDLSDDMKETLQSYTMEFTRPMVEKIFGADRINVEEGTSLQKILRDPDVNKVRENLKIMTQRTGIPMEEIPKFLSDCSDVFLSVAYYRYSFENVGGEIDRFLFWAHDLRKSRDVQGSNQTLHSCKRVEESLRQVSLSIKERLNRFNKTFDAFWANINRASFDALREQIEENHAGMGAVLCGLVVKMRGWSREFPDNVQGGPSKRAKFVMTEMEPGIERLVALENDARRKTGLSPIKIQ